MDMNVPGLLRGVGPGGVGVVEGAGPLVAAGSDLFQFPVVVFLLVVIPAEGFQFSDGGVVCFGPGEGVVDVTVGGVDAAGGEDTFGVEGFDQTLLTWWVVFWW